MLVANLDYEKRELSGALAIGRVFEGTKYGDDVGIVKLDGSLQKQRITKLYSFEGLKRVDETEGRPGELLAIAGVEGITIGETVTSAENPKPLANIQIDEPTIAMTFTINTSPFAGREGTYVTSRNLRDRLDKELLTNVSIRVEEAGGPDAFKVMGRGELQLAILIEMMRREGYELMVGKPEILTRKIDGKVQEPVELLVSDCPEAFLGVVIEKLGPEPDDQMINHGSGPVRQVHIPSRGLMGCAADPTVRAAQHREQHFSTAIDWQGEIPACTDPWLRTARAKPQATRFSICRSAADHRLPASGYQGMIIRKARDSDLDVNIVGRRRICASSG
jgi:GTP-binding protein